MLIPVILGIIQGITEFLPVSSTAHLILIRWFLGWDSRVNSLSFDVAVHCGTLISLILCFWQDIINIIKKDHRLLFLILLGTVPAVVGGLFLEGYVENSLRNPFLIATTLIVFGGVMIIAEGFQKMRDLNTLNIADTIFIGIAQAVALIPGVSRSGITISTALMLGLRRDAGARFAFLLSIPVVAGACILQASRLVSNPHGYEGCVFLTGLLSSMIAGILAVRFLLRYLKRHPLHIFAYYRFIIATIILGWLWLRV